MLASYLHGDKVAGGAVRSGLVDGSIPASINRLWDWYRECRVGDDAAFVDHAEYSDDGTYLWSYERRWSPVARSVLGRPESGIRRPRYGLSAGAAKSRVVGGSGGLRRRRRRQSVLAPVRRSDDTRSDER